MAEEAAHLMVVKKQREKGRGWDPNIPFKSTTPVTTSSH
jgi:hypothetical protein